MRRNLLIAAGGAAGLLVLAGAGPAAASCASSETTGTIVGGIGGALIGGAVGDTPGAFIGGLGGAVVGHEIGRSSCRHGRYYRYYRRPAYRPGEAPAAEANPGFYYDPEGRPIRPGPGGYAAASYPSAPGPAYGPAYGPTYGPGSGACREEERQYYDPTGTLVQRTVQVCDR